jgi:threonine/homoserine/homoserine lactone efflux protein
VTRGIVAGMPDPSRLALFVGAALLLLVVPGPSVLYIVTQSVSHGRRAGIASVAGITTGTLVHIVAATVGLSALLASSALAFDVVKYLGAAYLIVIGVRRLAGLERAQDERARGPRNLGRLYRQGIVVNTLNPKTALFFLAFLPQFVDPAAGPVAPQMLVLGTLLVGLGVLSDGTYALLAARAGQSLRRAAARRRRLERLSGGVFVCLGVVAALAGEPRTSS